MRKSLPEQIAANKRASFFLSILLVLLLSALGTTVAPGAFLALLFAAMLAQPAKSPERTG